MIISPETLLNSNTGQIIHEEFGKMDKKYQSLSLRFKALGGAIFASEAEKQSYLCGVASGYKELGKEGKDVGAASMRMNIQDDIPVVDQFYKNEYKFFNDAREAGNLSDKIKEKTDAAAHEDSKYYHKVIRQIQSGLIPIPYNLGVSMVHDFVVNKAAKPTR